MYVVHIPVTLTNWIFLASFENIIQKPILCLNYKASRNLLTFGAGIIFLIFAHLYI